MTTKIFLVDGHTLLRKTLRLFLESEGDNIQVIGDASTATEAVEGVLSLQPDIVLTEIELLDGDGIEVTARILRRLPQVKVLAVTVFPEHMYLLPFLEAGGYGYINKAATEKELMRAIEKIKKDEIFLSDEGIQLVAKCYRSKALALGSGSHVVGRISPNEEDYRGTLKEKAEAFELGARARVSENEAKAGEIMPDILSDRERQVLRLLSHGYNYREIGEKLFLSISTVETYKSRISEKLQMPKKTELIEYAMKHKIL